MKTLLFLTAGPYFWPHEASVRAKYEFLSKHSSGFILSFVSSKEWKRLPIGNFWLYGRPMSDRAYSYFAVRIVVRFVFVLGTALYLHWFKRRIDAIITYDPFFTGVLGYIIRALTGAKLVVEVNGDYADPSNWEMQDFNVLTYLKFHVVQRLVPFILRRADAVKLLYPKQLLGFKKLVRFTNYHCFHNFIPLSLFRPGSCDSRYILFIGHPWHRKGVDVLIKAFNQVAGEYPEWTLKLVGYLPEKDQYKSLYERNPQVQFTGPVMPEKVPDLMSACSMFVVASRAEGMPRVVIEAMASRKPVIASRVSGIPHYLKHEETALLFDSEDVDGLAQALRKVMGDQRLATHLSNNAYRHATTHLSEEAYVEKFMKMIETATPPIGS